MSLLHHSLPRPARPPPSQIRTLEISAPHGNGAVLSIDQAGATVVWDARSGEEIMRLTQPAGEGPGRWAALRRVGKGSWAGQPGWGIEEHFACLRGQGTQRPRA